MRLLIITQTVDTSDPILGFFHHWIEELAKRVEQIEVICLFEGEHALPDNVRVHSLGKEKIDASRQSTVGTKTRYIFRFISLIHELRYEYDSVFVHMNPEYVIIGGLWWRAWGKRIALWYNHPHDYLPLRIAGWLSDSVFYTSPHAASARFEKARRMPAGIDTDLFAPTSVPHDRTRLHLQGRIMPSKRIEVALAALRILRQRVSGASLVLVGPEHREYARKLRTDFNDLVVECAVLFLGPKKNEETPALYSIAGVALNLAQAGHFDKTVLEAMACETPTIVASAGWDDLLPPECIVPENDPQALAEALERLIELPEGEYRALGKRAREAVEAKHSLSALMDGLAVEMSQTMRPRAAHPFVWRLLHLVSRMIPHAPRMTVLLYHSISRTDDEFAVSPDVFERHLQLMQKQCDVVPLARAFEHAAGKRVTRDSVAITFDDGYRDFATEVVPLLRRYSMPATVFVLGGEVNRTELGNDHLLLTEADVATLRDSRITIGSHGATHQKLTRLSKEMMQTELVDSREAIEKTFGMKPAYLAYPKGSVNVMVEETAKECGYAGGVSVIERGVRPGDDVFALPRIQVDARTSLPIFKAKLTKAADWYYALWRLMK